MKLSDFLRKYDHCYYIYLVMQMLHVNNLLSAVIAVLRRITDMSSSVGNRIIQLLNTGCKWLSYLIVFRNTEKI